MPLGEKDMQQILAAENRRASGWFPFDSIFRKIMQWNGTAILIMECLHDGYID